MYYGKIFRLDLIKLFDDTEKKKQNKTTVLRELHIKRSRIVILVITRVILHVQPFELPSKRKILSHGDERIKTRESQCAPESFSPLSNGE